MKFILGGGAGSGQEEDKQEKNLWCLTEGIFSGWGRVTGQKF